MKLRDIVDAYGAQVSAGFESGGYAAFAPAEETVGFIATDQSGARGIAFMCDKLRTDLDGTIRQAEYAGIERLDILDSGEGAYADELVITAGGEPIRISDLSLEKHRLKALIEELSRAVRAMTEEEREAVYSEAMLAAAEHFSQAAPSFAPPPPEIERREAAIPDGYTPAQITEERIDWISGPRARAESAPEVRSAPAQNSAAAAPTEVREAWQEPDPAPAEPPVIPEYCEEQEDLSEMTHEQTLSYLLSSINEINAPVQEQPSVQPTVQPAVQPQASAQPAANYVAPPAANPAPNPAPAKPLLTEEPPSGDIYIKASRKLREFCELGTLTQQGIESAVKEGLIPAAEAFSQITAQKPAPPPLSERIAELKAASDGIGGYFALGEDIAARVMFFMLYQMLSYSDRLAELPETKQRLNDFFRRWGAAGITLSMLDMRVQ